MAVLTETIDPTTDPQFMAALEHVNDYMTMMAEIRDAFQKDCQKIFKESVMIFFDIFPELESFGWSQYTPYFNDGDVCEFDVHSDDLSINGVGPWDDDAEALTFHREEVDLVSGRNRYNFYVVEGKEQLYAAQKSISKFLGSWDQDVFKNIFGDHVNVTVYRNGMIETETCEHD